MNRALLRAGLRWHGRHRIQTLLLILGVALGVALVVGIDIANSSADRSFRLSASSLTGKATHQIVGGGSGISDTIFSYIRRVSGFRPSAPVVEGVLSLEGKQARQLRLLGVDPYAEAPFRGYLGARVDPSAIVPFLTVPGSVALSVELATELGVAPGDTLQLRRGVRSLTMTVAGVLRSGDELERRSLRGLLVADISTAQEALDLPGRLSHIDLIVTDDTAAVLSRLRAILPSGVRIETSGRRSAAISSMTDAFSLNLTALSLLALVVGMFLIYDTVSFSVVQRREQFGVLRAVGASRGQIGVMVLGETLLLASIGTAAGLALGIFLGNAALGLVTQTISDLYYTMTVTDVELSTWSLVKGAVLGLGAALIAALLPAREAMMAAPAGAVRRAMLEDRIRGLLPRLSALGGLMLAAGLAIVLIPQRMVALSFGAVLLVLLGTALLSPAAIRTSMTLLVRFRRLLPGVTAVMAARNISRSLSRTSVAIAALMIAVSVIVGVNTMIGSFRQTVEDWLAITLGADVFISVPYTGAGQNEGMSPVLRDSIAAHPAVMRVVTARTLALQSERYGALQLVAASDDIARRRPYKWQRAARERIWPLMHQGAVLISEPFAWRHGIDPARDSTITLLTDSGEKDFLVAGIFYDYSSDKGTVLMSDRVYRSHWRDTLVGSVAAYLRPDANVDDVVADLQRRLGSTSNVLVQSNRGLRDTALTIFDRTFTITLALQLLAGIVAFIGVFSALMALQLERGREIATLRATGMSRLQLARLILTETGLMGAVSGLLALPVGLAMALMLVYVINLRSFGWTLQLRLDPMDFVLAFVVAVAAALLAGIYPAIRFAQTDIRQALREEYMIPVKIPRDKQSVRLVRSVRPVKNSRSLRHVMFSLVAVLLIVTGCDQKTNEATDIAPDIAERSALTALSAGDTTGFARAYAAREFRFPEDDGPHPEFRTEWWYWTGNLETADGRRFGYQLTFFRQALAPGVSDSAWRSGQLYFANFALTDVEGRRFHAFERFNRGTAGLAGAHAFPFTVWIDDWSVRAPAAGEITGPVELRASEGDIAIALTLRAEKARILQGENGLSRKSAAPGNASYYYSLTRIASEGSIRIGDETFAVSGTSWLDREWSTSVLDEGQVGWDWFAMTFDDGSELMLYQLRVINGGIDPFSSGSFIDRYGKTQLLKRDDFRITPRGEWTSPRSGIRWPSGWRLDVPTLGLALDVEPLLRDQELPLTITYWEGAARITGTRNGYGYVELTGY